MDGDDMENLKIPKKTISDIVRKMIKKKNISIKSAYVWKLSHTL